MFHDPALVGLVIVVCVMALLALPFIFKFPRKDKNAFEAKWDALKARQRAQGVVNRTWDEDALFMQIGALPATLREMRRRDANRLLDALERSARMLRDLEKEYGKELVTSQFTADRYASIEKRYDAASNKISQCWQALATFRSMVVREMVDYSPNEAMRKANDCDVWLQAQRSALATCARVLDISDEWERLSMLQKGLDRVRALLQREETRCRGVEQLNWILRRQAQDEVEFQAWTEFARAYNAACREMLAGIKWFEEYDPISPQLVRLSGLYHRMTPTTKFENQGAAITALRQLDNQALRIIRTAQEDQKGTYLFKAA